jgi:hypothetical protein
MKIHGNKNPINKEGEQNLKEFFVELIDLCNKHRVTFVIKDIFLLRKEPHDGKLFDVAGFQYNEDEKMSFPVYVDRLS